MSYEDYSPLRRESRETTSGQALYNTLIGALRQFSLFSTNVGTETTANLLTVKQRLVKFFAPRDVLSKHHRYMRYTTRKPYGLSTRQYVGAVNEMNQMLLPKLPSGYDDTQMISNTDMIDNLAVLAPREHKNLMIEQGFDPRTATIETYVEICERAERLKKTRTRKLKGVHTHDSNPTMSQTLLTRKRKRKIRKSTGKGRNTSASIMVPIRLMTATLARYYLKQEPRQASLEGQQKGLQGFQVQVQEQKSRLEHPSERSPAD
jgi:hypothetical protein